MKNTVFPLLGAALLAFPLMGANGGCGVGLAAGASVDFAHGLGGLSWTGVDQRGRPLAVGTQETLTFEGAGCCTSYSVASSNPQVLAVTDLGNQTVQIQALAEGSAAVEVFVSGSLLGETSVVVAAPHSVVFAELSHAAAAVPGQTDVPATFSIVGQATLKAIITDKAGDELASQGLATCEADASGQLQVSCDAARERCTVVPVPAYTGSAAAPSTLRCGLAADQTSFLTYEVHVAYGAGTALLWALDNGDGTVNVLADAYDDAGRETYGLAWSFDFSGPVAVTAQPLEGQAAEQFDVGLGAAPQSVLVTATSGALAPTLLIP